MFKNVTSSYFCFQVEDIESKLDILIDLYKEDRKLILQKLCPPPEQNIVEIKEPANATNKQIPRSILVDKQYSEPSSPIVNRPPKRIMQRNHSDLGSRIRKRVTYRLHSSPVCPSSQDENLFKENNIPRSLSASYPTRDTFCGSEDSVIDTQEHSSKDMGENLKDTTKKTKQISDNVLSIPQFAYQDQTDNVPNDPSPTSGDLPSYSDAIERSNSQHSLLDVQSTCSDPFSPEEETKLLLDDGDTDASSTNQNQMTKHQSKSQELNEVCYPSDNHRVLVPIGTMKALSADVTEV